MTEPSGPWTAPPRFFVVGGVVADTERSILMRDGELIRVEPKVMAVLAYLAANPGRVVGKDELIARVWGGLHVVDEAVQRAVSLLRSALGDDARKPKLIETLPSRGYRLMVEPEALEKPVAPTGGAKPNSRIWGLILVALLAGIIVGVIAMRMARPPIEERLAPEAPTPRAEQPGPPGLAPPAPKT